MPDLWHNLCSIDQRRTNTKKKYHTNWTKLRHEYSAYCDRADIRINTFRNESTHTHILRHCERETDAFKCARCANKRARVRSDFGWVVQLYWFSFVLHHIKPIMLMPCLCECAPVCATCVVSFARAHLANSPIAIRNQYNNNNILPTANRRSAFTLNTQTPAPHIPHVMAVTHYGRISRDQREFVITRPREDVAFTYKTVALPAADLRLTQYIWSEPRVDCAR